MKLINKLVLQAAGVISLVASSAVFAQPSITIDSQVGAPGATVTVGHTFANNGTNDVVSFNVFYNFDPAVLTADVTNCNGAFGGGSFSCSVVGGNEVRIVGFTFPTAPIASGPLGTVDFTINPAAAPGTYDLTINTEEYFDAASANVAPSGSVNGAVQVDGPAASLDITAHDFGTVLVGAAASQVFTVTSSGTQPLTLDATAVTGLAAPFTYTNVDCDGATLAPAATCTFSIAMNTAAAGSFPADTFTVGSNAADITGSVQGAVVANDPIMTLSSTTVNMNGTTSAAPGDQQVTVSNVAVAPVTQTLDLTACTAGAGDAEIDWTGGAAPGNFSVAVGASNNSALSFQCSNAAGGTFSRTFSCTDNGVGNTNDFPITVNCTITAADASFNPVSGTTLAQGSAVVGVDTTTGDTVTITETGDDDVNVTVAITGADAASYSLNGSANFTIVNGGSPVAVGVTCDPQNIGANNASLDITTNAPAPNNDVSFPLTCTGIAPDADGEYTPVNGTAIDFGFGIGTLNESIVLANNASATADITGITCSFAGGDAAAFSVTTVLAGATIAPGASMTIDIEALVAQGDNFASTLTCSYAGDTAGDDAAVTASFPVTANGIVFNIPTLSHWGLAAFAVLLMLGGLLTLRVRRQS
ncbi:MAG: IPTL-CTERM sorting domain-containing protein [bacterium]